MSALSPQTPLPMQIADPETAADGLITKAEPAANLIAREDITHAIGAMSEPKVACFRW